jgi:hypothetical protein
MPINVSHSLAYLIFLTRFMHVARVDEINKHNDKVCRLFILQDYRRPNFSFGLVVLVFQSSKFIRHPYFT